MAELHVVFVGHSRDHRVVVEEIACCRRWRVPYEGYRASVVAESDDDDSDPVEAVLSRSCPTGHLGDLLEDACGALRLHVDGYIATIQVAGRAGSGGDGVVC